MSKKLRPPQHQKGQPGREHEMIPQPDYKPKHEGAGKLKGKVAIITGGDSGIGRATAILFAREGAKLCIAYLNEDKDAKKTRELIENEKAECLLIKGDIGQADFCKKVVDKTIKAYGQIDILVNNAAEQHPTENIAGISEEQLEKTFRTNIFSMFYLTKEALGYMKEGSTIVNCTSVTSYRGSHHLLDYASTKGAITSFTRSLSQNLAEKNIRVNGVAPGPVWTPLIPATFPKEHVATFGSDVPLKRAGQPWEIATCFLFLACDDSSYMTGQILHPNGGEIVGG